MEIEIVEKKENQLLERLEVTFKASHADEGTPQRDAVREKLSALLKAPKERVVVDAMTSEYEREHILVRNKLKEKKVAEKKAAAAPAEKPK
jgi:ribosomal protein S24E